MKKRKKLFLTIGITFLIVWLLTGGIVVSSYSTYYADSYNDNHKPDILLEIDVNDDLKGIPYLFQYVTDSIPYSLKMRVIHHDFDKYKYFVIEKINVKYGDGTLDDLMLKVKDPKIELLIDEDWYSEDDKVGILKVKCRMATVSFPACITKKGDLQFNISGHFLGDHTGKQNVSFALDFKVEHESGIYPMWYLKTLP